VQRLLGTQMPVLVFNRELAGTDWDFLALDNRRGALLATEHLIGIGHRRIAFFGGHLGSSSCRQRRQGYLDALAAAGIEPEPSWAVECAPTRLEATANAGALFARDPVPSAAVCYNDAVALGLIAGLLARGRRPGVDFALVGFDDIPEAAVATPPLTTIASDPRARGRQAAALLLARARGDAVPARRTVADVRLVVRGTSCAPVRGQA
jgi:LacI family transcriptional regulator